jgi:protein sidekick
VRVVWDPPTQPNGIILGYRVAYGLQDAEHMSRVSIDSLSSSRRDFSAKDLEEHRYYVFTVVARTSAGWGDSANEIVYTVTDRSEFL